MGGNSIRRRGDFCLRAIHVLRHQKPLALVGLVLILLVLTSTFTGNVATGRTHPPRGRTPSLSSSAGNRSLYDSAKSGLRQWIKAFGNASFVYPIVNTPRIKSVLSALPGTRAIYGSKWDRKHPFDRVYGTDTSGFLYGEDILTGHPAEEHGSPYAGVQPSVLRTALATLSALEKSTFIDLGCGKGRPMLIASEFPFRDIVGVELSPPLAKAAQKNAALIAKRFPHRTPVRVEVGDATAYPYPSGDVVLFIYNSFDRELMLKVVEGVEAALAADPQRCIYVVYCNPASGDCFDASPLLTRRFAQTLPYAPEERDFAEDAEDAVIIWQGGNTPPPTERADAKIVVVKERWRAELRA
jgi:SAM-dependent methyltransferase